MYSCKYHIVFCPKYRRKVLVNGVDVRLKELISSIADENKFEVIEMENMVNFHSKCKILGGVAEFFSEAFLCRFPPEDFPRPVVYPVHSIPV